MHAPKSLLLLSLLALTHALPFHGYDPSHGVCATNADSPATPYTIHVRCDHDVPQELQGKDIEAAGRTFWIGQNGPMTYCPTTVSNCPPGNKTVLVGLAGMNVEVPGGQRVYVESDGRMGFTQAHSASSPLGSFFDGFGYCAKTHSLMFREKGWLACPYVAKYEIYAEALWTGNYGDCKPLGGLYTKEYIGLGAWQYI
ncbi:MAG: hypothetical protein M1839_004596 [Geoglossum umbratile]|nr:MAG: hypothetical protein M1839_004596 [Geoglossum umbratile]